MGETKWGCLRIKKKEKWQRKKPGEKRSKCDNIRRRERKVKMNNSKTPRGRRNMKEKETWSE